MAFPVFENEEYSMEKRTRTMLITTVFAAIAALATAASMADIIWW
jgi:hypothetical protein